MSLHKMKSTRTISRFGSKTIQAIGYYVYVLVDPIDNVPFYVGKGVGNRVFSHEKSVNKNGAKADNSKDLKIHEIIHRTDSRYNHVDHYIVRYGLTSEHALLIESVLIDMFNAKMKIDLNPSNGLTNVNDGYYSEKGCITAEALEKSISSAKAVFEKGVKYLAINLNQSFENESDEVIYGRVRSSWILNPARANQADYILATHAGVIIGVYKMNSNCWMPVPNQEKMKKKRYYFDRDESADLSHVKDKLIGARLADKPKGAQNPVWYVSGWTNK